MEWWPLLQEGLLVWVKGTAVLQLVPGLEVTGRADALSLLQGSAQQQASCCDASMLQSLERSPCHEDQFFVAAVMRPMHHVC